MGQAGHVTNIIKHLQPCKITFLFIKYLAQSLVNVSEDNMERLLTSFQ